MLERDEIEKLIPHKAAMCLLERVLEWDATRIRLVTRTQTYLANPLRSESGLRAVHLCEYGVQAMAVHAALLQQPALQSEIAKRGMLVSLRGVKLHCEFIHHLPNDMIVEAECLHADNTLLQYLFRASHDSILLAEGRAAVALQAT